ncbi:3-phytase A [Grifola frondosa]|uniref:3-phytase A n=1 Tax=Grifola frondosa TaxID=5627 RepID=A0A1C7M032_GRIFR|nr:3-phytase A [Grifola frondosa]
MRLNAAAPHANLTDADTYSLMSLCPFESVAEEKRSNFCNLYDEFDAFEGFEYGGDLDKYYGTGYGQSLGPVQGVGYVNELLARLTNTVVSDHTQTNTTLDADPATFPLNHTLYADFSHDNQMIAIYAAMGLFPQHAALDPTAPNPHRSWRVAKLVPFSARMVWRNCGARGEGGTGASTCEYW